MLTSNNLVLRYTSADEEVNAVNEVNFAIPPTRYVGIIGPSGSGKSSLLYLLSGLKKPTSGDVEFAGQSYGKISRSTLYRLRREKFGFIFQQHFLINYLTVLENVLVPLGTNTKKDISAAEELLDSVGLLEKKNRFPYQLSGGQRQRVSVARALINRPEIIFADEPTASLDRHTGRRVMEVLNKARGNSALVVVTHDEQMLQDADLVYEMEEGKLIKKD